jgi:hypothetical protein
MIRTLFAALLALGLAACATQSPAPPAPPTAGAVLGNATAVATLSTNACEAAAAPFVSSLGVRRLAAASALRAGRITVGQAQLVQSLADDARDRLLAACPRGATQAAAADPAIAHARARIGEIEAILAGAR